MTANPIDPTLGAAVARAARDARKAEAALFAYVNAHGGEPPREVARGVKEACARINEARAALAAATETLRAAHARDKDYEAEVARLDQRHARALARLAKKYGRLEADQ